MLSTSGLMASARYLTDRLCKDLNKSVLSRSMHAKETLVEFEWFGNVRGLHTISNTPSFRVRPARSSPPFKPVLQHLR